jgi:hypothetical protein
LRPNLTTKGASGNTTINLWTPFYYDTTSLVPSLLLAQRNSDGDVQKECKDEYVKNKIACDEGNTASRTALFSKTIFNTCLLKGSSSIMDRYLKTREHNLNTEFTALGPAVCVLGKSGIGKTWAVHDALDPCIELTADVLKSKQDTLGFLEKIRGTSTPVLLDEVRNGSRLGGSTLKSRDHRHAGFLVIVSQIPVKFDFEIHTYHFPVPGPETIRRIIPGVPDEVVLKLQRGNLRYALQVSSYKVMTRTEVSGFT